MLSELYNALGNAPSAIAIVSVAIMLFCGFLMTRVTKLLRLPNVTAYILAGIIIGPYCLDLIPVSFTDGLDFLPDIALAFIALSTGEFFRLDTLKKNGSKVIVIMLCEVFLSCSLVFVIMRFVLGLDFAFSIVIAAIAAATTPTSTMMTIRQTNSKGDFVDTLLQVVALDDVMSLLAFGVAVSVALASMGGGSAGLGDIMLPLLINLAVMAVGCGFGLLLKLLMPTKRSNDNRLIITIALLFAFCGICTALDVSPLLGCMSMGTVYINITDDDKLFKQLNYFSPPILLLFFVRSGVCFDLGALAVGGESGGVALIYVALAYFGVRILGKYIGSFLGSLIVKKPRTVRNYLGLALVPQSSVAIGLSALASRMIPGSVGTSLGTVILATSVLYELVGPALAKLALYLSHSYSNDLETITDVPTVGADGKPLSQLEVLISRINTIQADLPKHGAPSQEEQAFDEAADEYTTVTNNNRRRFFGGRR